MAIPTTEARSRRVAVAGGGCFRNKNSPANTSQPSITIANAAACTQRRFMGASCASAARVTRAELNAVELNACAELNHHGAAVHARREAGNRQGSRVKLASRFGRLGGIAPMLGCRKCAWLDSLCVAE